MITVFTATYNRISLLPKLYESLICQSYLDFEWLIVDDGSTDSTSQYIDSIIKDNKITIRYVYQENAGKHAAINRGVQLARGDLFFILDSDEILIEDGLQTLVNVYDSIIGINDIAGVSGLKYFFNGKHIGGKLDYTSLDCSTIDYNLKLKYKGEMAVAYKTEILKEYPFPVFKGEKYCGEGLIWYKIAQRYKLRYFSLPIIYTDYYSDGLTALGVAKRINSPQTTLITYSELSKMNVPVKSKIKYIINFWRFFSCDKNNSWMNKMRLMNKLTIVFFPLGICLYIIDLLRK